MFLSSLAERQTDTSPIFLGSHMATCDALKTLGSPTGVYSLRPRGPTRGITVTAYCNMTQTPAGQSLFDVPSGSMGLIGSKLCTLTLGNDDMDSTLMWADFTGKVCRTNEEYTSYKIFNTLPRDANTAFSAPAASYLWSTDSTAAASAAGANLYRPTSGISSTDKPIPFPGSGVPGGTVVWLGTNKVAFRMEGVDYSFDYPASMTANANCKHANSRNSQAFITDGISSVAIARWDLCLSVLRFDWSAPTYTASMLSATVTTGSFVQPNNLHSTEQDVMSGDLLWTVKGRPCWGHRASSSLGYRLYLGTSLAAPFVETERSEPFYPSQTSSYGGQMGLDTFIRVGTNGTLWLGDWGHDDGGLFLCGNDNQLGVQGTTIQLAILPPPSPPSPPVPTLPPPPSPLPATPPLSSNGTAGNATAGNATLSGGPTTWVATAIVSCEGTVDSFDQFGFRMRLATFLDVEGVTANTIFLAVSAGSVIASVAITAPTKEAAELVVAKLQPTSADPASLSEALGVTVTAVSVSAVAMTDDQALNLGYGRCSSLISRECANALYQSAVGLVPLPGLIAISIVGGMLIGYALCGLCLLYWCCCRKKGRGKTPPPPPTTGTAWAGYPQLDVTSQSAESDGPLPAPPAGQDMFAWSARKNEYT